MCFCFWTLAAAAAAVNADHTYLISQSWHYRCHLEERALA